MMFSDIGLSGSPRQGNNQPEFFRPGEGEGAESHRQYRLAATCIGVDVSQELPDLNGVGQSRVVLDGGSLEEPADIHGDIAAAVPQSDAMAEDLPASLPCPSGRFQKTQVLDLLQDLQQPVGLY